MRRSFRGGIPRSPGHIARSLRAQTARASGCGRASPTMRPEVPRQGKPAAAAYPPSLSPASLRRYPLERVGNQLEGRERRTRPMGSATTQGSESRAQSRSTAASLSMFTPRDRRLEPGSDMSQIEAAEEHPSRGSCPSLILHRLRLVRRHDARGSARSQLREGDYGFRPSRRATTELRTRQ